MRPSERVRILVDAFNEENIERVLDGVTTDIEVFIPLYRLNETAGPPVLKGREELRQRLLQRHGSNRRIELTSISDDGTGAIASMKSSRQGQLAVAFKFDDQGLARRLIVFKQ